MPHAFLVTADELPLYGLSIAFIDQFDQATLNANLQAVTDELLGRMSPAIVPPILEWGSDIRAIAARIAVYELKSLVGLSPPGAGVGDENLLLRAQEARKMADSIGLGQIQPQDPFEDSSTSTTSEGAAVLAIKSDEPRGW
jgi:hypothetical protein